MGAMSLRQKKDELKSESSHKSDIYPSAPSKKWGEIFGELLFHTFGGVFHKSYESKYHQS